MTISISIYTVTQLLKIYIFISYTGIYNLILIIEILDHVLREQFILTYIHLLKFI